MGLRLRIAEQKYEKKFGLWEYDYYARLVNHDYAFPWGYIYSEGQ